jgi:hypothetical protein
MVRYERQKEEEEKVKKAVEDTEWKVVAEAVREKAAVELKEKWENSRKKVEEKAVGTCILPK